MDNPFLAALDCERRLREEAYLDLPHNICGIPCRQITPRLLAVLFRIRTPYLTGEEVTPEATLQFLWAVDRNNPMRAEKRKPFQRSKRHQFLDFIARGFDFDLAELEIDQFLNETFLDAPDGKPSRPYVCSIAWLEYSMSAKPFLWDRERTLETPIRVIYQLLRCRAIDNGISLTNRISDRLVQEALEEINSPEAMEKRAAEFKVFAKRYKEKIEAEIAAQTPPDDAFQIELDRLTKEFENKLGGNN